MESLTLWDFFSWIGMIAGAITGCTVIYNFLVKQRQKSLDASLDKALKPILERQAALEGKIDAMATNQLQNDLETARVDLMQAIQHAPSEHQAILALGERYFLELQGDTWMSGVFRKWAEDENVDINYIISRAAHLKN